MLSEYLVLFTWDADLPVERWQIKSVGPHTETIISVVNTTTDYFLRVQARNEHGFGPKSDVVRFHATPTQPAPAHGKLLVVLQGVQVKKSVVCSFHCSTNDKKISV